MEAKVLITLGILFLFGLVTEALGRRMRLPRVTLLILFGVMIGPSILNLLPAPVEKLFPIITDIALAMVGFLLGGKLTIGFIKRIGYSVLIISMAEVIMTSSIVCMGLMLIGVKFDIALLLGGIASATAPAATIDVIHQMRADGKFTRTLLGIVAIDDAWALILFSFLFIFVHAYHGQGFSSTLFFNCAREIVGAIILGIVLGFPMAYLTGRIRPGEPTLIEALGVVFICCGLALWLHVSFLMAAMTLGFIVTNVAHHHTRPFHAIENIEWPFMLLFFILAGVSLHLGKLYAAGMIGISYILLRILGRILGGWCGGILSKANCAIKRWMGLSLLPQAGVAIGMALLVVESIPSTETIILPTVLGATVIFEIIGPIITRIALIRVGETKREIQ